MLFYLFPQKHCKAENVIHLQIREIKLTQPKLESWAQLALDLTLGPKSVNLLFKMEDMRIESVIIFQLTWIVLIIYPKKCYINDTRKYLSKLHFF